MDACRRFAYLLCVVPMLASASTAFAAGISGRIQYYSNGVDVPGATVELDGSVADTHNTDSTGGFAFEDLAGGSWSISPRKLGDRVQAITMLDVLFAINAAVGLGQPTDLQRLAADVSGDGTVSAYDAALLLQYLLGLIDQFPVAALCGSDWIFSPLPDNHPNQQITPPAITGGSCETGTIAFNPLAGEATNQSFRAVLFGDPSGDWLPAPIDMTVEVVASFPHDPAAYTQGLLLHDGKLYESTGLDGPSVSSLREVDPETGEVLRLHNLAPEYFGEGLARVGNQLIQLTWQNQVAFAYDVSTFAGGGQFAYAGEGWGLCHDGTRLVMTDGTSTMYFRDPTTFAVTGQVAVSRAGQPQSALNELECVGRMVYANVFLTDLIVVIDKQTGVVVAEIDASGLLTPEEAVDTHGLNGIAYKPATDTFLLTGKRWPKLFEVRFVADSD